MTTDVFEALELKEWKDTKTGPREHNEDRLAVYPDLGLLVIADGMGGGDRGDVAAERACELAAELWREASVHRRELELVDFVIRRINTTIFELGKQRGLDLGTTLTLAAFERDAMWLGHVGDTRLYRLRDARVELLTEDQRAAGNMLAANIGGRDAVEPFLRRCDRRAGDLYLLATDGWWSLTGTEQIAELARKHPPEQLGPALMEGRERVATDNLSLLVCWDRSASRSWWSARAADLRTQLADVPAAGTLGAIEEAARCAAEPCEATRELERAWSPARDAELVDLAREALTEEPFVALLERLAQERSSTAAALALADRVVDGGEDDPAALERVRRAYRLAPDPTRAYYLLSHTDPADTETFQELTGYLLKKDPGPWFRTWTLLWEVALRSEGGAQICREILAGLPEPSAVPGATLLGEDQARHPLDRLLDRLLAERLEQKLEPLAAKEAAAAQKLAELSSKLVELERAIAARQSDFGDELRQQRERLEGLDGRWREREREVAEWWEQIHHNERDLGERLRSLEQDHGRFSERLHQCESRVENIDTSLHSRPTGRSGEVPEPLGDFKIKGLYESFKKIIEPLNKK